jgi:hypothetical protein
MSETTFPQVSATRTPENRALVTADQIMAEIDRTQKALDTAQDYYYRSALMGRIRTLEWVLGGGQ